MCIVEINRERYLNINLKTQLTPKSILELHVSAYKAEEKSLWNYCFNTQLNLLPISNF